MVRTYRFAAGFPTDQLGYDIKCVFKEATDEPPDDDPPDRRKPAWTDRILHMYSKTASVKQLSYQGYPGITMSDHRPVSADFVVSVCGINS